jgi:membrane-associated protein
MDLIHWFVDFFLHLDQHLAEVIQQYGTTTYLLLFLIVFLETGLVVTPILPGDSLLFAAGTFACPRPPAPVAALLPALRGRHPRRHRQLRDRCPHRAEGLPLPEIAVLQPEHLKKTHAFYEKYGGKTIIIARFVPIVRTFAPFVAGVGQMSYRQFIGYNVVGGILWVTICVFAGYFFGNLPFVKKNFSVVVIVIVLISLLPAVIEYLKHRAEAKRRDAV